MNFIIPNVFTLRIEITKLTLKVLKSARKEY